MIKVEELAKAIQVQPMMKGIPVMMWATRLPKMSMIEPALRPPMIMDNEAVDAEME